MPISMTRDYPELPYNERLIRFHSKYWTVDYNAEMVGVILPVNDTSFRVSAQWRTNKDFLGVRWQSRDLYSHDCYAYATSVDYSDTVLALRVNPSEPNKFTCTVIDFELGRTYRLAPYVLNPLTNRYECLEPQYGTGKTYPAAIMKPQAEWTEIPEEEMTPWLGRTDYIFILDFNDLRTSANYNGDRVSPKNLSQISFDAVETTSGLGRDATIIEMVQHSPTEIRLVIDNSQPGVKLTPGDQLQYTYLTLNPEGGLNPDGTPRSITREGISVVKSWSGFGTDLITVIADGIVPGVFYRSDALYTRFLQAVSPTAVKDTDKYFYDLTVTGTRTHIDLRNYVQPAHSLMMTSGFDDNYPQTPERQIEMVYKLGYRGFWNVYIGMSHYFSARTGWRDLVTGAFIPIDPLSPPSLEANNPNRYVLAAETWSADPSKPVNRPTMDWFRALFVQMKIYGYSYINSVAYEILNFFMHEDWKQRDYSGAPALSGWKPPSSFIQPTNQDALDFMAAVQIEIIEACIEAEVPVKFQIGEPWWWDGTYTNGAPCIYDANTVAMYEAETGNPVPTPWIQNVYEELAPNQIPYMEWLRDKLGASTNNIRDQVKARFPDVEATLLFFTPQIFSFASELTRLVNFPIEYWKAPQYDFVQIEDYDWIIEGRLDLVPKTFEAATDILGYARSVVHYFTGFIQLPQDYHIWAWIDKAIQMAKEVNMPYIYVWSYTQVMRDSVLYNDLPSAPLNVPIWDVPPNWKNPYRINRQYKTDILTSRGGKEQRRAMRETPRKTLEFSSQINFGQMRRFQAFLSERQGYPFYLPELVSKTRTAENIAQNATTVLLERIPGWLQLGTVVILAEGGRMDARVISKIDGNQVDFLAGGGTGVTGDWPKGTKVYYALYGMLATNLSGRVLTSAVTEVQITFNVMPGSEPPPWNETVAPSTYAGREIFTMKPNWAVPLSINFSTNTDTVDNDVGIISVFQPVQFNDRVTRMTFWQKDIEQYEAVQAFFERMKGMQNVFWCPTWLDDFDLDPRTVPGSTIYVRGAEVAQFMVNDSVYKNIAILTSDNVLHCYNITNIGQVPGEEVTALAISPPLTAEVRAKIKKMSWLVLCRLATDQLTTTFLTDEVATFELSMQTLQYQEL